MTPSDPLLTVPEVAAYLACAEETVKRLVRRGLLPAVRVGSRLRFHQTDIERYLAERTRARPATAAQAGAPPQHPLQEEVLAVLAGECLDLPAALEQICERIAAAVGDGCVLVLLDESAQRAELTVCGHSDRRVCDRLRAALAAAPYRLGAGALSTVIQSGQPLLVPTLEPEQVRAMTRPVYWPLLELLPVASLLIVPLRVRARTLGALALLRDRPGHPYTPADQRALQDAADRVALVVDHDRLDQAREAAERSVARAARYQRVTEALAAALTPALVADVVMAQCVSALEADTGIVATLDDSGDVLQIVQSVGFAPGALDPWQRTPLDPSLPLAEVVLSGEPRFFDTSAAMLDRYPTLAQSPLMNRAWALAPIRLEERVLGSMYLGFGRPRTFDADDRLFLQTLAYQCAQALERARLYEVERRARAAAEASQRRLAFLAEASRILSRSLDLDETLAALTRLLVPQLADYCTVQLLDPHGAMRMVAVAHVDRAKAELLRAAHRRTPADPARRGAWEELVLRGESLLLAEIPPDLLERLAEDAGARALIQTLRPVSGILAPLRLRGRILGALQMSMAESGRHYTEEEFALAQNLADRLAMAVEHARLYEEATRAQTVASDAAVRATFLAEVSQVLAASLTDGQPLRNLTQKVVSFLADACVVYQHAGPYLLRRAALAHRDPHKEHLLQETARFTIPLEVDAPVTRVVQSGQTEVAGHVPAMLAQQIHADPDYHALVRALAPRAYLCTPLVARGRVLGALALIVTESDRTFSDDEVALAEELARRVALALDNTRLYHAAQEAIAVRDQFLTVAAHELKTPLTALLGNAQLLERRLRQEGGLAPRHERSLQVITEQAKRLNHLVTTLLDTSRLETGQLRIERRPVELGALARRVAEELQPTLVRHTITCEPGPDGLVVDGDELRLEQVLQNLLINAVKYSPEGGPILVELCWQDDRVALQVRDEGIGIPADELPNIFGRFYRASNAAAGQLSGIGIGLYVVNEIVTLHGGSVMAASAPGQGSTFTVWLPRGTPAPVPEGQLDSTAV
jgi:excisionase family DNA binding protein